jgi:hypothetical protein
MRAKRKEVMSGFTTRRASGEKTGAATWTGVGRCTCIWKGVSAGGANFLVIGLAAPIQKSSGLRFCCGLERANQKGHHNDDACEDGNVLKELAGEMFVHDQAKLPKGSNEDGHKDRTVQGVFASSYREGAEEKNGNDEDEL